MNDPGHLARMTAYSDAYIEKCFVAWYTAGCPDGGRTMKIIPQDEMGRTPHPEVVKGWIKRYDWHSRADILNEQVAREIEKKAVEIRVEMLNRQAELGKQLQEKGMEYLEAHEFEKAGEALKAVISGAELERSSRGLPEAIMKVAEMRDEDLAKTLDSLLGKASQAGDLEKALGYDVEAEFSETAKDAPEGE